MDFENALAFPPYPGEFLHPVVYACTSVLLLCMLTAIVTYVVHHSAIRISRQGWHVLLNLCVHTALTFTAFAGGINRITSPVACQVVGIVLHYSSLASLLWLGVSARFIYTQVSREAPQGPDGDPCSPQSPPTGIVRFYLVSDGVPLLICTVTAATNIQNYGSSDSSPFCWIAWEPSLGAFYCPVALVVVATCGYFLCASIQLRRHPERRYELQVTPEERRRPTGGAAGPGDAPGATLANELSLRAQLRTAAFTLLLFLSTWAFGALAVWLSPVLDMVFSCLYGASCASLGLFLLIQHCAKREDVWQRWWACRSAPPPAAAPAKPSANGDAPSAHAGPPALQAGPCCVIPLCQRETQGEVQTGTPSRPPLQSCLKDRAKPRPLSRYTYQAASSSLDSSAHGSYPESPQCALELHSCHTRDADVCHGMQEAHSCHCVRDTLPCSSPSDLEACHGTNEGRMCHEGLVCAGSHDGHACDSTYEAHACECMHQGHVYRCMREGHICNSVHEGHTCKCMHEGYTCRCTREGHACSSVHEGCSYHRQQACPQADPFAIVCHGTTSPSSALYGYRKMANRETLLPLEMDSQNVATQMQAPTYPPTQTNQNKSQKENSKQQGHIRTGLWKNETSV
ncbi:adhesion G protein-coupled receptor A1 [Paramormyrops kingsleyae]|uniref:adhesion G protein-coupled receptor A1 n=1 Tax=Paramormyrops kingsleyae TaxID=1676925 RepID=UPI003B96E437